MRKNQQNSKRLARALTLAGVALLGPGLLFSSYTAVMAAEPSAQNSLKQSLDIDPGSLEQVLNQFGRQAGILLSYSARDTAGYNSQGLQGEHSIAEGLKQILVNTPLRAQAQADGSYIVNIVEQAQLPVVTVTGENRLYGAYSPIDSFVAKRSATGTKTATPLADTPQSVSVVTQQQLEMRGAKTITQALQYSPSLSVPYGYDTRYDWFSLRGFDAKSQVYRDGLLQPTSLYGLPRADNYTLERVESLRGPSSVLFGQAQPGGFVNLVSKRPTRETLRELRVTAGNDDFTELAGDFSGAVDDSGNLLYRLIFLGHDTNSEVDQNDSERKLIAPSLSWQISDDTQLTVMALEQHDDQLYSFNGHFSPYALKAFQNLSDSFFGGVPVKDREFGFFDGETSYNQFERDYRSIGYEFSHAFNETWSFRQNLRYDRVETDYRFLSLNAGSTNLVTGTLGRSAGAIDEKLNALAVDNQIQAEFDTSGLTHRVLMGLDWRYSKADEKRYDGTAPSISYIDPQYGQPVPFPSLSRERDVYSRQTGLYLQDQMAYQNWRFLIGGRYDWAKTDIDVDFDNNGGSDVDNDARDFSGRLGLVYKFDNGLSPYISYSEAFNLSQQSDDSGNLFDPETALQYEVGLKYEPAFVDAFITMAYFDLTKDDYILADYDVAGNASFRQVGEVNSRGIEIEAALALNEAWKLSAAYSYIDARITESPNAWEQDAFIPRQPRETASVWLDYSQNHGPLQGLALGAGLRYVGESQYIARDTLADSGLTTTESVDLDSESYTLVDASVRYDMSNLQLGFFVSNLFDKEYDTSCSDTVCYFGDGRRFTVSATYNW